MWNPLKRWFSIPTDAEFEQQRAEILKQAPIPEIWLFGKTGSGKSSIIRYLTGAQKAEAHCRKKLRQLTAAWASEVSYAITRDIWRGNRTYQPHVLELKFSMSLIVPQHVYLWHVAQAYTSRAKGWANIQWFV